MCTALFAWRSQPGFRLILAHNRDEFLARPALPAHIWQDAGGMRAGRDQQGGGSWLGVHPAGRFAFVTNYREPTLPQPEALSRGKLVRDFVSGNQRPHAYLEQLQCQREDYPGFNLVVGDAGEAGWLSNRGPGLRMLQPGVYALSNHLLDSPWPKLRHGRAGFEALLAETSDAARLLVGMRELLGDTRGFPDHELPDTGLGIELERFLAPLRVRSNGSYATRCTSAVLLAEDGGGRFVETSYDGGKPETSADLRWGPGLG